MSRIKGTPKTGGRNKGTPNKVTGSLRNWIANVLNNNRSQIESDLQQLEPKDRLQMLERLMQYVVPKQQAVSASIDLEKLSDEQLDLLICELTKDI